MKRVNFKKVATSVLLTLTLVLSGYQEAHAKKQMVSSISWVDSNGCIWIESTYQHSFIGINL